MEKENYKEKILIKPEKIQELLDYIAEIKLNHEKNIFNAIKIIEKKCYEIITKKCIIRWNQRLRQKNLKNHKILKKGIIFKIK